MSVSSRWGLSELRQQSSLFLCLFNNHILPHSIFSKCFPRSALRAHCSRAPLSSVGASLSNLFLERVVIKQNVLSGSWCSTLTFQVRLFERVRPHGVYSSSLRSVARSSLRLRFGLRRYDMLLVPAVDAIVLVVYIWSRRNAGTRTT